MCFIMTVIGLVMTFNFFMAEAYLLSAGSFLVAIFFIRMMIQNIKYVRELKKGKDDN